MISRLRIALFFLFLGSFSSLWAFFNVEGNNPPHDTQTWYTLSTRWALSPKADWGLLTEQRFADGSSKLNLGYIQIFYTYRWKEWFIICPSYFQQWILRGTQWVNAYVPSLDGTVLFSWKGWDIADRNRAQFFMFDENKPTWLYRNRVLLSGPWRIGVMKLRPFFSDEVFFLEDQGFFENRAMIGGNMVMNDWSQLELYYMRRDIEIGQGWRMNNVLGLNVQLRF